MRVSNMAVELPLDTLLGPTFDGVDLMTGAGEFEANAMAFDLWSLLLNHGYHLAGTASSDACFDRKGGAMPGVVRTYSFLPNGFSLEKVTKAVARGANFVSSGPLLLAMLDSRPPGSGFRADGKPHDLKLEGWASGTEPEGLSRFELLWNGKPIQTNMFIPRVKSFETNLVVRSTNPGWYCVRLFGSDPQRQRAITGAFFFQKKDFRPPPAIPATARVILRDAATGEKLAGSVREVAFHGTVPRLGKKHSIAGDDYLLIPGTMRLYAEAPDHKGQMKSPFLDSPPLLELIKQLSAEDLLKWETFERVRRLLTETTLCFDLERNNR